MEEDKKVIAHYFGYSNYKTFAEDEQIKKSMGTLSKSIVNIINELEILQKEYERLKEKHKITCKLNVGLLENMKDFIPKQVIRNKIEEVNKEYKKYTEKWEKSGMNKEHPFYRYIVRLEAQIDILEELLNEVN